MNEQHEQALALRKQDAAQDNAGAENPVAPGSPEALRLPRNSKELRAFHKDREIKIGLGGRTQLCSAAQMPIV